MTSPPVVAVLLAVGLPAAIIAAVMVRYLPPFWRERRGPRR